MQALALVDTANRTCLHRLSCFLPSKENNEGDESKVFYFNNLQKHCYPTQWLINRAVKIRGRILHGNRKELGRFNVA